MLFAGAIAIFGILVDIEGSIFQKYINNLYIAFTLELTSTIAHALGFYLLLKRKVTGLLVILFSGLVFLVVVKDIYTAYYLGFIIIFTGLPYILSFYELTLNAREKT